MEVKTLEMKISIPEVKGGRIVSTKVEDGYILVEIQVDEDLKKYEYRVDPDEFSGKWLNHEPKTKRQAQILKLYNDAKEKGKLHAFTCIALVPLVEDNRVVYSKDELPISDKIAQNVWNKLLKEYEPDRHSRQMTITEFACFSLLCIKSYVSDGYEVETAWELVCDKCRKIGGGRRKLFAKDKWDDEMCAYWSVDGYFSNSNGELYPKEDFVKHLDDGSQICGISLISLD